LDTVIKVHNLFKDKKWIDKDIQSLVFEGFCQLLILLEEDEREFIIELVKNYHWITQGEYQERLINALNAINVDQLDGINKIYFFRLLSLKMKIRLKVATTYFTSSKRRNDCLPNMLKWNLNILKRLIKYGHCSFCLMNVFFFWTIT
jgi:hypothetical protein